MLRQTITMTTRQTRLLTEEVRIAKQKRLDELERQAATLGTDTPPHINIEIEDLYAELELVSIIQRPSIDPKLRKVVEQTDQIDLLGSFIGKHAYRLTQIESWQTKRDEQLVEDDKARNHQRHKLDLVLGALIVATIVNGGFNLIVMIIMLTNR
jgi:hypothetical protein